jgi:hypothetical protein
MTILITLNKVTFLVMTLLMTDFTFKMTLLITANKNIEFINVVSKS